MGMPPASGAADGAISERIRLTADDAAALDLPPTLHEWLTTTGLPVSYTHLDVYKRQLDYRLEASAQKAFAKGFEGDPNVAVPGVIDGTERVLVTEWMDGIPLSLSLIHI